MSSASSKQGRLLSEQSAATSRADLGKKLEDVIASVNEQRTDHATSRSSVASVLAELKHMCLAKAGLAKGTTASRVKTANTVDFLVNGTAYQKVAFSQAFTASSHDIVALASNVNARGYVMSINASGTAAITAGAATGGGSGITYPARPANQAPIGKVKVVVASGATAFDASTDSLTAAHLTVSYTDVAFLVDDLVDPPATLTAGAVDTLS